ncbi:MAG: phosphate regulon transcriptional regulatory protein PhoB [Gammaproteobacteria bacterium]|nr:phosphate regulon transcriptional regulatory protein PhoB [Gammaproteobacteria bacterium]
MSNKVILVVDDEPAVRDMIGFTLEQAGFQWVPAADVVAARQCIQDNSVVLVLLDWMMPGVSGYDFARELRADITTRNLPVILLTARDTPEDMVRGLDVGADDYMVKPFSPREMISRVKALLRRVGDVYDDDVINIAGLSLDTASHRVMVDNKDVVLGPTEYKLLHHFMQYPDRVFSRNQLLDYVWGQNVYIDDRTVDVHIRRLRKALIPYDMDKLIQTVRGSGYRFSRKA